MMKKNQFFYISQEVSGISEIMMKSGMLFIASFLGSIILLIANLILSKNFEPETFGNFKTVVSLSLFLFTLIEFGAGTTLTKYISEFNDKRVNFLVREFLKLRIVSYILLLGIIFIFRKKIAIYFLKDPSLEYLILAGMFLFATLFFEIFNHITLGFQKFKLYSFSQLLTLSSIGFFAIVLGSYFGVFYAIIGWGLGYFFGNLLNVKFSFEKKVFERSDVRVDIKKIFLKYSIPVYLLIIPSFLGNGIIPILSLFFSQKLIGYFAFAMIFHQGIILIPGALYQVLFPKFSQLGLKNLKEAKATLKKVFFIYSGIVIFGIPLTLFFSEFFINFFARDYLPGLIIFKTLVVLGLLLGYLLIYESYLTGLAKIKKLIIVETIRNVSLFVISFLVIKMIAI